MEVSAEGHLEAASWFEARKPGLGKRSSRDVIADMSKI